MSPTIQTPDKMIEINPQTQDFGGGPNPVEDGFGDLGDPTYSPTHFMNHEISKPMPPKREAASPTIQPPAKMIKINPQTHDFGGDPNPVEDGFTHIEDPIYSPTHFANHETDEIGFEENCGSPGIRTDTISLLMKIEQLQAELKYERRCRILAEKELRELKGMNTLMMQMRHTAHELRVTLDHVRHGSDGELPTQSNDESISFITENEMETRLSHHIPQDEDENFLYLSDGLRVPRNLYDRISQITDYKKYVSALLMMLFDRETLATHSLQGRRTNVTSDDLQKPQLPPDTLRSLIDHVGLKFGVDVGQVKTAIRTKLNNEDKLLKKRLGIVKSDGVPS